MPLVTVQAATKSPNFVDASRGGPLPGGGLAGSAPWTRTRELTGAVGADLAATRPSGLEAGRPDNQWLSRTIGTVLVQPGDGQAEVARTERLGAVAHQDDNGAGTRVGDEDGRGRPGVTAQLGQRRGGLNDQFGDLDRGTLPDEVLERCPRHGNWCGPRSLAVCGYIPRPIGADQSAEFFEIAAGCPRGSAPPRAEREADRGDQTELQSARAAGHVSLSDEPEVAIIRWAFRSAALTAPVWRSY